MSGANRSCQKKHIQTSISESGTQLPEGQYFCASPREPEQTKKVLTSNSCYLICLKQVREWNTGCGLDFMQYLALLKRTRREKLCELKAIVEFKQQYYANETHGIEMVIRKARIFHV